MIVEKVVELPEMTTHIKCDTVGNFVGSQSAKGPSCSEPKEEGILVAK